MWVIVETPGSIRESGLGSRGRTLMVAALQVTVNDGDRLAVTDILQFCIDRRIILHITEETASLLVRKRDY